jgi:hypothetical protein
MQDLAAWHHTKTSLLTVRPVYRAEWEYQFGRHNQNAMEIDGSNGSKVSKKLWRLNVPTEVVEIFGWQVLHGLILA